MSAAPFARRTPLPVAHARRSRGEKVCGLAGGVGFQVRRVRVPVLGNSFGVSFGFSGMARFAEQLRDARTRAGWAAGFAGPGSSTSGCAGCFAELADLVDAARAAEEDAVRLMTGS